MTNTCKCFLFLFHVSFTFSSCHNYLGTFTYDIHINSYLSVIYLSVGQLTSSSALPGQGVGHHTCVLEQVPGRPTLCSPGSLPLVVTGTTDFNTNQDCSRAMDPDMTFGSSPGPCDTMALGGCPVCSDLYGPGRSKAFRH